MDRIGSGSETGERTTFLQIRKNDDVGPLADGIRESQPGKKEPFNTSAASKGSTARVTFRCSGGGHRLKIAGSLPLVVQSTTAGTDKLVPVTVLKWLLVP